MSTCCKACFLCLLLCKKGSDYIFYFILIFQNPDPPNWRASYMVVEIGFKHAKFARKGVGINVFHSFPVKNKGGGKNALFSHFFHVFCHLAW